MVRLCAFSLVWVLLCPSLPPLRGDMPIVDGVEKQPLQAAVARLVQALKVAGNPLDDNIVDQLTLLEESDDQSAIVRSIQECLDPFCLAAVHVNPESRVHVMAGPAKSKLIENGWRTFLVKVINEAGVTGPLRCSSPQAKPMMMASSAKPDPELSISPAESERRWLDIASLTTEPMRPNLSGLRLEYCIVQLYSRDAGKREATLQFDVGQGTQDLGSRSQLPILFDCQACREVRLSIRDWDNRPTTCSLLIRDEQNRVYPNPARRLAPDFFFHHQIYRGDGETVRLPPGNYQIVAHRGPEYLPRELKLSINSDTDSASEEPIEFAIRLKRWIDMASYGWISGDHHVHAAGCAHYESPTQGVLPQDMMRHILGEDLNVGCVLTWGPCWYHQKQFFDGKVSSLSTDRYLMRYDIEVSGFPSSHAGHLCLLNLIEDDYPNTTKIEEWPSWTLPVLQWGKSQGGVVGYSHSGWGLALPDYLPNGQRGMIPKTRGQAAPPREGRAAFKLPDYELPPFDGIGANEYIVAVAHDACDFISAVDTPAIWELNIWYHTLNCGFRTRISGETDFPCIYDDRVGLGRVYVQKVDDQPLSFEPWIQGIKDGRSYVGDGLCHISHFSVNDFAMGQKGSDGSTSQLSIEGNKPVVVKTKIAAMLTEAPSTDAIAIHKRRLDEKPYWHLERARIDETREVPVELIVNGKSVQTRNLVADGRFVEIEWKIPLEKSSWIALRVFPSMHTNPIFVEVDGKPIRASIESAKWCREAVDRCWERKSPLIRDADRAEAALAYEFARQTYDRIIAECAVP